MSDTTMSSGLLRPGSRGDDVRQLQERLALAGYDPGPADGAFGRRTEAAVRAFQADHDLAADGIVGPLTWASLQRGRSPAGTSSAGTPAPSTPSTWSAVIGDDRMRYAMRRLVDHYGYPANGAAGLVGNLWAESGVIPDRIEGSRPQTPMRSANFAGAIVDFTAEEVMNRDPARKIGPRRPGIGLAQWTSPGRRAGLFTHTYDGIRGVAILVDMDAQLDYLDHELRSSYSRVHRVLTAEGVTVEDASDEVLYNFEIPGSILDGGSKLPRTDERVQEVFRDRREYSRQALRTYEGATR